MAAEAKEPGKFEDTKPNIVLIMVDDMGFSDIGCYGSEINTPNLDRLAANGVRFTQISNTARCCPARASLMTGLYPHQAGMGWMTAANLGPDGYAGDLNDKCVTIPEALKSSGYRTYMSGKWHLTYDRYYNGSSKHSWPCQRGFDKFYGTLAGAGSYFKPHTLTRDNTPIKAPDEGYYYTDAISDEAAGFIRGHQNSAPDTPFFLYVAYTAPHWPLHAKPEDIARYEGQYMKGWDALRAERHQRQQDMGIVDPKWPLSPRDEHATAWDELDDDKKKEMARRMAIYAAQIDSMDQGVGKVVDALEKTGQLDNTLIFFLSDNGGCHEGGPWGFSQDGEKLTGGRATFDSYGLSWANASNTPFRMFKSWVHEGGISTPLIVQWPARLGAEGELRHQRGHMMDIMPTCVDVAGAVYPDEFHGKKMTPLQGVSLSPAFEDKPLAREPIFWEHEANRAMLDGKWKLVAKGLHGPWELYDMEADRTELNNLSEQYPEQAAKMAAAWQAWAEGTGVFPLDDREWGERVKADVGKPGPQ